MLAKPSTACGFHPVFDLVDAGRTQNRADRDAGVERRRHAVRPERGLHAYGGLRPIAVLRHVLLARPHQLHRLADLFGDQDRLPHLVVDRAASEAAAEEAVVDVDLLGLEAGGGGRLTDSAHRRLRADPDVEFVGLQVHRGVERLHGGMREMRRFVGRLDDLAAFSEFGIDVAVVARAHHRPVQRVAIKLGELRAVGFAGFAGVPFRLEQRQRFLGAPEAVGDDGDRVVELDDLLHAAAALGRRLIDASEFAAEHRTGGDRGIDHAGQPRIDGEPGGAVDLERRIEPRHRLADELELVRGADRRLLVELDLAGIGGERAVVEAASRRLVQYLAVGRFAFARRHVPALRGSLDQPHARAGAGLQQHLPRRAHAAAAHGRHRAVDVVVTQVARRRSVFDLDLRPVAFEFLGDNHRQRGDGALPHLLMRRANEDAAIGADGEEGVDLVRRGIGAPGLRPDAGRVGETGKCHADGEAAGGGQPKRRRIGGG